MAVNTRIRDPNDPKDLPMEINCDHSHSDNLLVDNFDRAASCDYMVGVALELRMARFAGPLARLEPPQCSQEVDPLL